MSTQTVATGGGTWDRLSPREHEILELIAQGCTSAVAARRLGVARATVETFVASAMRKLGARSRVHAVALLGLGAEATPGTGPLSAEQRALLGVLAAGGSLESAARQLHVSRRTAARRLADARAALGVRSTAEAVALVHVAS